MLTLVLVVILAALVFEFINGFHDTANSIATVVATKVLSPGWAVMLAAGMNLIGALTGTAVALTIASGLLNTNVVEVTPQVILCALLGGIIWNLITWWKGLPSSSSHALIGGLCGAGLAAAHNDWDALIWSENIGNWAKNKGLLWKVFVPMITSPIAGFVLGIVVMVLLWAIIAGMSKIGGPIGRLARPRWVNAFFGKAQIASAAYMGYAHGHNDAQKTMGIIAMTLIGAQSAGALDDLPSWLSFLHPGTGLAAGAGIPMDRAHLRGGDGCRYRVGRLEDHQDARPQDGQAASHPRLCRRNQLGDGAHRGGAFRHAGVHHAQHFHRHHGVGFAKNPRSLRLGVIERIVWAWILTIPAAGGVAYLILTLFELLGWT